MPSTVIGRIDYDAPTRRLLVTFVPSGRRYAYFDVPIETFESFRRAFSKGSFFNTRIRDRYESAPAGDS